MRSQRRYDEKRLFCRMEIDAEVFFSILGDGGRHTGRCRNLSHSGIQFDTEKALSEGQIIQITIDTKSEKFKPMNATVKVLRIETADNSTYRIAGKITEYG